LAFCLAIEGVLKDLEKKGYILICYCDDLVIAHKKCISASAVKQNVRDAMIRIGLVVNEAKCKTTENGGAIKFLD